MDFRDTVSCKIAMATCRQGFFGSHSNTRPEITLVSGMIKVCYIQRAGSKISWDQESQLQRESQAAKNTTSGCLPKVFPQDQWGLM
jgi:hypothetical protein